LSSCDPAGYKQALVNAGHLQKKRMGNMADTRQSDHADKKLPQADPRDAILADMAVRLDQTEQRCLALSRQVTRQTDELAHLSQRVLQAEAAGQPSGKQPLRAIFDRLKRKLGRRRDI
jgi:hypothetical protein